MKNIILLTCLLGAFYLNTYCQPGLVGSYLFNGNATDASGNGNNGVVNGATLTTDRFGNPNSAYLFNGTDNYINIGNNFSYTSHSFVCWAKRDTSQGNDIPGNVLISKVNNGPYEFQNSEYSANVFTLGTGTAWTGVRDTVPSLDYSKWNCYVATYDAVTGTAMLYTNGIVESEVVGAYADVVNTPAYIGARPYWVGTNGPAFFFKGAIDDVKIFNRALTPLEVDSLSQSAAIIASGPFEFCNGDNVTLSASGGVNYHWNTGATSSSITVNASGTYTVTVTYASGYQVVLSEQVTVRPQPDITSSLVADYPFNGNADDVSGNGYNGSNSGATLTTDRFGNPNNAYSFNGVNNYIDVNDAAALRLNSTDYTISFWTYINSYNVTGTAFIYKRGFGNNTGWAIGTDGGVQNKLALILSEGIDPRGYSSSTLTTGDWHHVAVVYSLSSQQLQFYFDGTLANTTTGVDHNFNPVYGLPTPNGNASSVMRFGQDSKNASYWLNGKLDDIKIYSRALAACDITSLFNDGNCSLFSIGTIAGTDTADIDEPETYTVTAGFNYTWSVTNGSIVSGQNTNSVEIDWDTTGQGTLQVIATDQGCADTVSKTVTLVDPINCALFSIGTIAGADTADIDEPETYSVTAGFNYTWSVTNGSIVSGQNTNNAEIDWDTTGQGTLQLIATDQGCADTVSKTVTIVDPTGIDNVALSKVDLYPNPATDVVTLRVSNMQTSASLKLYDFIGKEIFEQTVAPVLLHQGMVIDMSMLSEGTYFLSIQAGAETRVVKLIKRL